MKTWLAVAFLAFAAPLVGQMRDRDVSPRLNSNLQQIYWDESSNSYKIVPWALSTDMDGRCLGLGASAARVCFDDAAPDEIEILSANVGIGIAAPDGAAHVHSASAGTVDAANAANTLVVEDSSNGGVSILVPDASWSNLYLGSPSDNIGAFVAYSHSNNLMSIGTQASGKDVSIKAGDDVENIRIEAAGQVSVKKLFNLALGSELTLDASGDITVTQSHHRVDTYEDATPDTLDTINGAISVGDVVVLASANSARDVIVAEGGNIYLDSAGSFTMNTIRDRIVLIWDGTYWTELSRSDNN